MLTQLSINHLAIVQSQTIDLAPGLTVLTGETGAGKSLLLDGLGLILGERADSSLVTQGKPRAEVSATFSIDRLPAVGAWLNQHELDDPDSPSELNVRRTLTQDGRSKAYVNGRPITLADLRQLASQLVSLQGQHGQYDLLRPEQQLRVLDQFGDLAQLKSQCAVLWREYQHTLRQRDELAESLQQAQARQELLAYQVKELDEAALQAGEVPALEQRITTLSNAQDIQIELERAEQCLSSDGEDAISLVQQSLQAIGRLPIEASDVSTMLSEALVNLQESAVQLRQMSESCEQNPAELQQAEDRLSQLIDLARKHRIEPEALTDHWQALSDELQSFGEQSDQLPQLNERCERLLAELQETADRLTQARTQAADHLSQQITEQVHRLELDEAQVTIALSTKPISADGQDAVSIEFTANAGSSPKPLSKVASGGELSRVALAIQVCIAAKMETPTLIFDEVDVGIGGRTAAVVGELLKSLSQQTQVFVVTHQPQVAAAGQTHLHVSKSKVDQTTASQVRSLAADERVMEVARMLGGLEMTDAVVKSAQEMIMSA